MYIWTIKKWVTHLNYNSRKCRKGLRLKIDKDVDLEVKRACKEFCVWLRTGYFFPVRVPIYLKNTEQIKAKDGSLVSAIFFEPYDLKDEPYIQIAIGEYAKIFKKRGQDNALAAILCSIAHELTHYFQWINGISLTPIGTERQASQCARLILNEYANMREHP